VPTEYLDKGVYSSGQAPADESVGVGVMGIDVGASDVGTDDMGRPEGSWLGNCDGLAVKRFCGALVLALQTPATCHPSVLDNPPVVAHEETEHSKIVPLCSILVPYT